MVAKERIPSAVSSQLLSRVGTNGKLTHCCNNLGLKTVLVLEATSEVADTALAVGLNIGNLADVVEHVSAREEQNGDQADGSPEVAVLNDWQEVRCGDGKEGEDTDDSGCYGDDLHVVDRTLDGWVGRVGEMAAEPCVDGFGLVGAGRVLLGLSLYCHSNIDNSPRKEVKSGRRRVGLRIGSSGRVEEKQDGCGLKLHRLEGRFAVQEVQCCEQKSSLSGLVSLGPAASQQVVLGLEIIAKPTSKSCLQGGKEHGNRVVARGLGELAVRLVVESEGARSRELLSVVLLEQVAGGFLRSQCGQRQQGRRDQGEELHCRWRWWW
jgi:hypothetical protein